MEKEIKLMKNKIISTDVEGERYLTRKINRFVQYFVPDIGENLKVCIYYHLSREKLEDGLERERLNAYYKDLVSIGKGWEIVDTFIDEDKGFCKGDIIEFQKMIENCKQGKYDLIITPSFTNFYGTRSQTYEMAIELLTYPNPVIIFFEVNFLCSSWSSHFESKLRHFSKPGLWQEMIMRHSSDRNWCIDYSSSTLSCSPKARKHKGT
jgi:hypothetical protein